MQFSQLYGIELDRELGSADTTQLFTTARRKAATNAAQQEYVTRTECVQRLGPLPLVDETPEYDLEVTFTDFVILATRRVSIRIVSGTSTRYIAGKAFTPTTVEELDDEEPNWRAESAGTPRQYYTRKEGGAVYLGLHPAPAITGSDVWTALVPYIPVLTEMALDADEPFTVSSNPIKALRPYHRALPHFAAYDLEKLRKDAQRSAAQLQLWEMEIAKYIATQKPKGSQQVRFVRNYRASRRPLMGGGGVGTVVVGDGFDEGFG